MSISDIKFEWRRVRSYLFTNDYGKAFDSTFDLILESFLWLFTFVIRLPFLLPAILIMLVAKFSSKKL